MDISCDHRITWEDIENHPELPWNWKYISQNPTITLDFVLKNHNKRWDWSRLTLNSAITREDIKNHPELPWDHDYVKLRFN
jgi:hypothetical protein